MQLQSVTAKLPNCVLFDRAWLPSVSPAKTPRARASVEGGRGTIARRGLSDAADAANRGGVRACRGLSVPWLAVGVSCEDTAGQGASVASG